MSDSIDAENLESVCEIGSLEEVASPSLHPPPNPSPNIFQDIIDEEDELLRAHLTQNFENESTTAFPSEMPSLLLKPSENVNSDTLDSQKMLENDESFEPFKQFETMEETHEKQNEEEELDDTFTSPHPASQEEREIQQVVNKLDELEKRVSEPFLNDGARDDTTKQRITPMPSDPAEDTKGPNMGSMNQSIMNSLMVDKEYKRFFPKSRDAHSVVGFNMKEYEEELIKLRNDNFSLKLRIHLLEDRLGLVNRPEDKQNVYRVNIDLQVEKEALKKQIDEKDELIKEAADALHQMELEWQMKKSQYEEEISGLRNAAFELNSPEVGWIGDEPRIPDIKTTDEISANSHKLLLDAFGSVNLGTNPDSDEENEQLKKNNEQYHQEEVANSRDDIMKYKEIVESLEKKLQDEEENGRGLKILLEKNSEELISTKDNEKTQDEIIVTLQNQLDASNEEKRALQDENELLIRKNEGAGSTMNEELEVKREECTKLYHDLDRCKGEMSSLYQKIDQLEQEVRIHKQESTLSGEKVECLVYELATLKSRLDQEKRDSDSFKAQVTDVDHLKEKIKNKEQQLKNLSENQTKAELCITGLTEINMEQKQNMEKLEKSIQKRDKAIEKLTLEYEKVKAKVRKYRSLKLQDNDNRAQQNEGAEISGSTIDERNYDTYKNDEKENIAATFSSITNSTRSELSLRQDNKMLKDLSNSQLMKGTALDVREKEKVAPVNRLLASNANLPQGIDLHTNNMNPYYKHDVLKKRSNSSKVPCTMVTDQALNNPDFQYLKEEVELHQKEIELLKGELRVCKNSFMRSGASKAMEKVEKLYSNQMSKVDSAHSKIVGLMRKRLEELAECIQKILGLHTSNQGLLSTSNLSNGDVSALSDILNESKRLSKSFYAAPSLIVLQEEGDSSNQNQSICMELNEGEIKNDSVLIDPNETQLPAEILKFPVNNILEDIGEEIGDNEVIDYPYSPKTPVTNVEHRLREYESLMNELKASKRQKIEAHHELVTLKKELEDHLKTHADLKGNMDKMQAKVSVYISQAEQLQGETIYWKMETEKQEDKTQNLQDDILNLTNQVKELERELDYWKNQDKEDCKMLKTKLAEATTTIKDLRIKRYQDKDTLTEKLRESANENEALRSIQSKTKAAEKCLEQLCRNYQAEIEELKEEISDQNCKSGGETKQQLKDRLQLALSERDELKGQLQEAEHRLNDYSEKLEKINMETMHVKTDAEGKMEELARTMNIEIYNLRSQLQEKDREVMQLEDKTKSDLRDEVDDLRRRLKDAESMLSKYQSRQEKVDKKLRSELAKTHHVLKKTKLKLEKCKE